MREAKVRREPVASTYDLQEAERFLSLLGARQCTFQTFDDKPDRKSKSVVRVLHGDLSTHEGVLADLNRQGAGVFVTLNQTDGSGRKRENVRRVRAVALDLDGAPIEPVMKFKLKPHIVVESSPGRYHAYWRVKGLQLEAFEDVQRAVASRFDGDPAIAKLTHCARIPGFDHCKHEPFRTRIVTDNDLPPYTADEIIAAFPPSARSHTLPMSLAGRILLPADDPWKCAAEFAKHQFETSAGTLTLRYYRGNFYQWLQTHYAECEVDEIRSLLYRFLADAVTRKGSGYIPFKPNKGKVSTILDALQSQVRLSSGENAPFWLENQKTRSPDGLISCLNGILKLSTRKLLRHNPDWFNVNSLPFDFEADAPLPRNWLNFLNDLWPDDDQARDTLQEIFGLLLTPDTKYHKIFMLLGPKRSGKGTIARVLTSLLGKENVVHPTIAGLNSNFGLSALIDKRAAIISDARLGPQTNTQTVAERLLTISGDDSITVDRKYREPWTGHLSTRFVILTNELPRISDASGALASRFVLLTMQNSFYGKEDLDLTDRLLAELPGIMNWALEGLNRLRDRGRFETPSSSKQAIRQLDDLASPVRAFLRDWCEIGVNRKVKTRELYDAYTTWCDLEGHSAGGSTVFGRDLRAAVPGILVRGRGIDRFYQGVGMNPIGKEQYERAPRSSR